MLIFDFDAARQFEKDMAEIRAWLDYRPNPYASSWYEFCRANDWTFSEMLEGIELAKKMQAARPEHLKELDRIRAAGFQDCEKREP